MRIIVFLQSLICLLVVSCSIQDLDTKDLPAQEDKVYYATLESYAEPDTKVYINENNKIYWDANDRISLFESTLNREFRFTGNTGDNTGKLVLVTDPFGAGNELDYLCGVYPYQSSTNISNNNVLTLTLPEIQTYREGSFGRGANTMVSVTKDNPMEFKNVGGYLVLKFYGDGVSVSAIKLEGENDEKLAGEATMTPAIGVLPKITMASTANTSITLTCDKPVDLGTSKESATMFWMVVPPTTFTKGFKLTVTGTNGKESVIKTDKEFSIARNSMFRISPMEVTFN